MTNEEAKFLLQGYRPGGRDAQDPQFAEALEQVRRDPALQQWFQDQQALDQAVSDKLRTLPVPSNLKAGILAGRRTIRVPAWWVRRPVLTLVAACLAALLMVVSLSVNLRGPSDFAEYRADMVRFVTEVERDREPLELTTRELTEIRDWMADHSIHRDIELPRSLTEDSGVGCRVIDWNGTSVSLVCFRLKNDQVAHLLVIDRDEFSGGPRNRSRVSASLEGKHTTAWAVGSRTYLLISSAPAEMLNGLL